MFHDNLIVNTYKQANFLGYGNLWTQFDRDVREKISPYQLFITTFGGAATPTKTTCFLPLLCTAGTLDTHQLTCIQDCCPGYQSLSKGPGLRGSFRRDRRGGRGGEACWLLDGQLCFALAGWEADLCHNSGRIHRHPHCVTKAATDIMLPLTHLTFLETQNVLGSNAVTYPPTSHEKKNLLQLANVSPSIRGTPTDSIATGRPLQNHILETSRKSKRTYQNNSVSQYTGL